MKAVEVNTGFRVLRGVPKPGQCATCAVFHEPEQPHDAQSLHYQYCFFEDNGRWPTWTDALAHCTPEIREKWVKGLADCGIIVDKEQEPKNESTTEH